MMLREIMTTPVLTFSRAEPASDALARMRDAHVRHGVVLSGHEVIGIVSERDLGGLRGGILRKGCTVADLMRGDPLVASPQMSATKAALLLRQHRIGCLPILHAGRLVGIITRGDLLEALARQRRLHPRRVNDEAIEVPRLPTLSSPNRDKSP
jgi:CBS domain-containing protein